MESLSLGMSYSYVLEYMRYPMYVHIVRQKHMSDPGHERLIRIAEILSDCMGAGGS